MVASMISSSGRPISLCRTNTSSSTTCRGLRTPAGDAHVGINAEQGRAAEQMVDVGELAIEPEVQVDHRDTPEAIQLLEHLHLLQGSGSSSLKGSTGKALT